MVDLHELHPNKLGSFHAVNLIEIKLERKWLCKLLWCVHNRMSHIAYQKRIMIIHVFMKQT